MASETNEYRSRKSLLSTALFLGVIGDPLTMISLQNTFLIVSKGYTEVQVSMLFFVFGVAQVFFQASSGYLMDVTDRKTKLLSFAVLSTTILTVLTVAFAAPFGANIEFMATVTFCQGAVTTLIPAGLNSITQGVVGAAGMTEQVSRNEAAGHTGTFLAVFLSLNVVAAPYSKFELMFFFNPVACAASLFFINRIHSDDIDHDAARGLARLGELEAEEDGSRDPSNLSIGSGGEQQGKHAGGGSMNKPEQPDIPLHVLFHPTLMLFSMLVFLFHCANDALLPLVMQNLTIGKAKLDIAMSAAGLTLAQCTMITSALVCGSCAGIYGRRNLLLVGFLSVPVRCLLLTFILHWSNTHSDETSLYRQLWIVLTQILDGVANGLIGTLQILVASDMSVRNGRFGLTLGNIMAAAACGRTLSGYLSAFLSALFGYEQAFFILMLLSSIPALLFGCCMPETLTEEARLSSKERSVVELATTTTTSIREKDGAKYTSVWIATE